jgi:hypothetical protein
MTEKVDRTGKGFRKLLVWQKAHQLVLLVYKLTENFPKHEMFGLKSQLQRAMVSVPANVAEAMPLEERVNLSVTLILLRAH